MGRAAVPGDCACATAQHVILQPSPPSTFPFLSLTAVAAVAMIATSKRQESKEEKRKEGEG
jgi:hypothetical protein